MKIEQNPFSLYDFLGYLVPGLFFCYAIMMIWEIDFFNTSFSIPLDLELDQYFIIVIIAYIVGHVLSYLSSVTVELYSIWTLGYPSRYLLNFDYPGFWRHILHEKKVRISVLKLMMVTLIFPVVITDLIIRKGFQTPKLLGKSADKFSIELITQKLIKFYNKNFEPKEEIKELNKDGYDFYNIIYHFSLESCTTHISKMQNYVALYGFTRTLCFSLILIIWVIIFRGVSGVFSLGALLTICSLVILSGILYLDFNKFYRKFSLESFMAFLTIMKT